MSFNKIVGKGPAGKLPDGAIGGKSERRLGVVKWFSRLKGYGFIQPDDGSPETFVHYSAIIGDEIYKNLYEGDEVEYDLVDRGKGPQAQNVKVLNRR